MSIFKGFQDTSRIQQFKAFPKLNLQMNNEAYGFSGCTFWLDAAFGLNTQTDGASVSNWVDRIKNIKFSNGSAANQPTLVSSDASFNNYPTLNFAASKMLLGTEAIGLSQDTIVFIAKVDTISALNVLLSKSSDDTNQRIHLGGNGSAAITGIGVGNGLAGTYSSIMTSSVEDTLPHICLMTPTEIVIDGVQVLTGTWDREQSYDQIGSQLNGVSTRSVIGRVAEILIFNRKLTTEELIILCDRINSKYAIY